MIGKEMATNEELAIRMANLHHMGAHVVYPDGKHRQVTNLGWLLRKSYGDYGVLPTHFTIYEPAYPNGYYKAIMVANYEDGTVYATAWASKSVLVDWLDRPTFRGVPIDWRTPKPYER